MKTRFRILGWIALAVIIIVLSPIFALIWAISGFDISEFVYDKIRSLEKRL